MHFACRSFIGKHSDFNWSQYWENEPDDISIVASKGHIFGLINFSLDYGSAEISKTGKDTISKINNFYYYQTGDITTSLKDTLKYFQTELSPQFIQSTLTLVVSHKNLLYFAQYNTGHVIIRRNDKISQLLFGQENQISNISGQVISEDKILLCTDDFYQNIGFSKIKSVLGLNSIQTIEESFISQLYTLNNQPNLAGALIEIHFDDNEDIPLDNPQNIISPAPPVINSALTSDFHRNPSFLKKIFHRRDTYVSHSEVAPIAKRKKINFIISSLLLIGLVICLYFGYQSNQTRKNETEYQKLKTEINQKISDSIAIKTTDLNNALESAKSANSILEKMIKLNLHVDETTQLKKQIDSLLTQTGQAPTASSHDIVVDLKTYFSDFQFQKITFSNNQLVLLDTTAGVIKSFDLSTQKSDSLAQSAQIKNITSLSENNGTVYYVSGNQLYLINQGQSVLKVDFNKTGQTVKDIAFWNGVLYVLDSSVSKIYKFVPSGTNFDSGSSWLKEGNTLDANPVSLSINSSIWLLSSDGKISSFTRGIKDKIEFQSANLPTSGVKIVTSTSTNTVVVNSQENYIYIYKSTGELNSKYNFSDKKINDITVNEKESLIYILCDDQKIYKVSL